MHPSQACGGNFGKLSHRPLRARLYRACLPHAGHRSEGCTRINPFNSDNTPMGWSFSVTNSLGDLPKSLFPFPGSQLILFQQRVLN